MAIAISRHNIHEHHHILEQAFRLRHKILNQWLKWGLPHEDGMEIDEFDFENSVHFVSLGDEGELLGYWRLMPTVSPYLAEVAFPNTFGDRGIIKDSNIWESSRFVIDRDKIKEQQIDYRRVVRDLYGAISEFCFTHHIGELISVTTDIIQDKINRILGEPIWQGPAFKHDTFTSRLHSHEITDPMRKFAMMAEVGLNGPCLEEFKILAAPKAKDLINTLTSCEKVLRKSDEPLAANLIGAALVNLGKATEENNKTDIIKKFTDMHHVEEDKTLQKIARMLVEETYQYS